jgi:hypothetical protein
MVKRRDWIIGIDPNKQTIVIMANDPKNPYQATGLLGVKRVNAIKIPKRMIRNYQSVLESLFP